jgi:hypothetical protein
MKGTVCFVLAACALAVGCKKDNAVALAESASALATVAPPATAMVVPYAIDKASKTSIDMPGLKEHIMADTDGAAGKIDVDLMNLKNTRGEVKIDLTTLKTHTFHDDRDESQTHHALNWLQVGDAATPQEKAANQYAVFAIESVDKLSATNVSKVAPTKDGSEDIRTVTATVHGEFLVHGHKAKKDVPIEARFHYPAGAKADSDPTRVDIKSTSPLSVTLKEHDVHPRDNFGKLASWTTKLISKVAETAAVSLDLHADLSNANKPAASASAH